MKDLLALAMRKAQQAEVFLVRHEETPVIFEANRLKQVQTSQGTSVALRLVKDGRIGFASSTTLDDAEKLVEKAVAISEFGAEAKFELPARRSFPRVNVYDQAVADISIEEMVRLGEEMIERVLEHGPDLLCEAGVSKTTYSVQLQNSRGGEASYTKSIFGLGVEGMLVRDTDMLFVGESDSSCHVIKETGRLVEKVKQQLDWARKTAPLSTGRLPVIFTSEGVAGALLAPMLSAFNGRTVLQGASPLQHKQGQQVFDRRLTVYDDGSIPTQSRSRPCDDEGLPSRRNMLVDKGVIGAFIYDLQTAGMAGAKSTGSGERGSGGLPSPSMSTLVIEGGEATFADMVRNMQEGIIVEQLMGAGQTNVLGGDFSGNILLGYKVERGEVVGRVKDAVLSGNVYQLLDEGIALSSDARWVRGLHIPAIYCPDVAAATKG